MTTREQLQRWRDANPEKVKAQRERQRLRRRGLPRKPRTPEQKARAREATERYRKNHPERIRAYSRKHYIDLGGAAFMRDRKAANRKYHRQKYREWYARNREQEIARVAERQRIAYEDEAREFLSVLRSDPCSYCGGPAGHVDHIDPLSRGGDGSVDGGDGSVDNLTATCKSCNSSKMTSSLLMFLIRKAA
jgi:5-methylcytosine-specific restriction endonuclease McrA